MGRIEVREHVGAAVGRWARRVPLPVVALVVIGLTSAAASSSQAPAAAVAEPERAEPEPALTIESGDEDHIHGDEPEPLSPPVALEAGRNDIDDSSPWAGRWGPEIEPLAAYEPQRLCVPGARPAVAAFVSLLARAHPEGRNLGISRACDIGSRSEHKEGRAYDWGVSVDVPAERRAADQLLAWLLATDEHGNEFAMARRLGVMYVIWDGHIWSAAAARDGWRVYTGASPHTDHVHLSFSWDGATGATSFWDAGRIGPWLLGSALLDRYPETWHLGGAGYRAELGPRPGAMVPWSADETHEERRDPSAPAATTPSPPAPGQQEGAPAPSPGQGSDSPTAPAPTPSLPSVTTPEVQVPPMPLDPTTTVPLPPVAEVLEPVDDLVQEVDELGDALLGG
jgi:hypothetical protein